MEHTQKASHLKPALGPVMLWGLGVGYVISGEYFGWNLGLPLGGTYGMLIAFALITVMYITFVFSYTEMACAIPRAGGVFVYSQRSLGLAAGYLGGIAQAVEFVFAPPAIAMALGGYIQIWISGEFISWFNETAPISLNVAIALFSYAVFTALNIWGVRQAATFELIVTILAVSGLVLFAVYAIPRFSVENFTSNPWPNGWSGMCAAIPFAIWFYLAIEGVANAAEEAVHPQRDVSRGFGAAIITLVLLACCAFFGSVGVGGWERVVYSPDDLAVSDQGVVVAGGASELDSPLPLAISQIVGVDHLVYHLIVGIGLLGFIASFNGIILASGRALFEMGRVGFFPRPLGSSHPKTKTPVNALLVNLVIGAIAILFFDTGGLITMSAFGAVTLYIVSMVAVIRLRHVEPDLPRPYRTPFYPVFPVVAMVIAVFSLATMTYFNFATNFLKSYSLWYFGYVAFAYAYYFLIIKRQLSDRDLARFQSIDDEPTHD